MNPNKIGGIILIILGLTLCLYIAKNVAKASNIRRQELSAQYESLKENNLFTEEEVNKLIDKRMITMKVGMLITTLIGMGLIIGGISLFRSKYFIAMMEKNGIVKKVATGYSWKSLFFGIFYPMARSDMKGLVMQLILCIVTIGTSWLIIPFVYNKRYMLRLIEDGYKANDENSAQYLKEHLNYKPA